MGERTPVMDTEWDRDMGLDSQWCKDQGDMKPVGQGARRWGIQQGRDLGGWTPSGTGTLGMDTQWGRD